MKTLSTSLLLALCVLVYNIECAPEKWGYKTEMAVNDDNLDDADCDMEEDVDQTNAVSFLGSALSSPVVMEVRQRQRQIDAAISSKSIAPGAPPSCVFDTANTDPCDNQFREHSGRCTNKRERRRSWGMAGTSYTRKLAPVYADNQGAMRTTDFHSSGPVKSARKISTLITDTTVVLDDTGLSAHIMQMGQFMAHEFTLIVDPIPDKVCCIDNVISIEGRTQEEIISNSQQIRNLRPDCIPIENFDDPVHGSYHCIRQTRSLSVENNNCSSNVREQMNGITHVIDASAVYGSSLNESIKLRAMEGGKMKVQTANGFTLPPPADDGNCPDLKKQESQCPFVAGDHRVTATPNLIALHTVYLVVHNKIASRLSQINPNWDDERLYQETRRIIYSIQARIFYDEYLPILLGETIIKQYGLNEYNGFDEDVNPAILNELAGGAFRLHTLIDGFISLIPDTGSSQFVNLRDQFFKFSTVYSGGIKQCILGLTKDKPWKVDRHYPTQMRDQLFRKKQDIFSLNLQRGRDHGFQSYLKYREAYGLFVPDDWEKMMVTHSLKDIENLKKAYKDVKDIEFYSGGSTEKPQPDGVVGPLFANILAEGFKNTRDGDSFYYESSSSGLNTDQMNAIKKYTYAKLLCEGAELEEVPDKAFFRAEARGIKMLKCAEVEPLNLELWRERTGPPPTDECVWKITSETRCCNGQKTINRLCIGETDTCKCVGERTITPTCYPNDELCPKPDCHHG